MNYHRADLKFNIICTPGAVQYAPLFALSLRKWSDCSFRLVANGCSLIENRVLLEFCEKDPRFEFFALPVKTAIQHGKALSYLQSHERSDTFCFMDSDILATGEFLSELTPYLNQYAGVFSGSPVWLEDEDKVLPATFQEMAGRYSRTDQNICLGSSYFAIYDNQALTQTIQSTGIGLNRYPWANIPVETQNQLVQMGLRKTGYDTSKLLNLLLLNQGERLLFSASSDLQHVGGISTIATHYSSPASQVRVLLSQFSVLRRIPMPRPLSRSIRVSTTELLAMRRVRKKKIKTCRYIGKLLHALFQERPLPTIPSFDEPQIGKRVERLTTHIIDLHKEFREQL
jgi:hypothetical protein